MSGGMTRAMDLEPSVRAVSEWRDERLRCAIGHRYPGKVREVEHRYRDMDAEWMSWQAPVNEYDPPRCIVCGLLTYALEQAKSEQGV